MLAFSYFQVFALIFQVFKIVFFWIMSSCSGCVVLFLGCFLLLGVVFRIFTHFHIFWQGQVVLSVLFVSNCFSFVVSAVWLL